MFVESPQQNGGWEAKTLFPLVNIEIAIENDPVEIVDFPINSMVIFHCYVSSPEGRDDDNSSKQRDFSRNPFQREW